MAETGAAPAGTLMIGDTTFDIEMALRRGVGAVGVGWGYHPAAALRGGRGRMSSRTAHELARALDDLLFNLE